MEDKKLVQGKDENKEKKQKQAEKIALARASKSTINSHSQAQNVFIDAYTGKTSPTGKHIKGLKDVSKSKLNSDYEFQNLSQQSGYSTEIMYEAKVNAENIKNGSVDRISRTDNVGMVNDQKYDFVSVDANGNPIYKANGAFQDASQMKVKIIKSQGQLLKEADSMLNKANDLKNTGDTSAAYKYEQKAKKLQEQAKNYDKFTDKEITKFADKLSSNEWERYRKEGNDILVPSDQFQSLKKKLEDKQNSFNAQAKECRQKGDLKRAKELDQKARDTKKTSELLKSNDITSDKSMKLRTQPKIEITKEVLKTSHEAGLKGAKQAAIVTGTMSAFQNTKAVIDGDKELVEALLDTSKDVATSCAVTYCTAAGGTLAKTGLDKAAGKLIEKGGEKALVKVGSTALKTVGNNIGIIVSSTIEVGKSLDRYFSGEIDSKELIVELGQKGTGILGSTYGTLAGTAAGGVVGAIAGAIIAGPAGAALGLKIGEFVGSIAGSMLGYMAGTQIYNSTIALLQKDKLDAAKRKRIEAFSNAAYEYMKKERDQLEELINEYYEDRHNNLKNYFKSMDKAVMNNDVDGMVKELENIAQSFDGKLQFKSFDEFKEFMLDSDSTLVL